MPPQAAILPLPSHYRLQRPTGAPSTRKDSFDSAMQEVRLYIQQHLGNYPNEVLLAGLRGRYDELHAQLQQRRHRRRAKTMTNDSRPCSPLAPPPPDNELLAPDALQEYLNALDPMLFRMELPLHATRPSPTLLKRQETLPVRTDPALHQRN